MTEARSKMNGKPVFTVPAKTVVNFKSHFDRKLLCDGMTFTAGSGCVYRCAFCYVPDMQRKQQEWFKANGVTYPAEGHLGVVIRTREALDILRRQIMSKPEEFRQRKQVIYSSPKVDVAGNMELVRETVEICKEILSLTNWDIRLLSKSNLLPKVAQGLEGFCASESAKKRIIYGVSTGTLDDKLAAAFEHGTPKVSKRIESLHWLQDNGFRTFGMICPSLPQWRPGLSEAGAYFEFAKDMAAAIRADRCEHVWAEVINVRGESFVRTEKALRDAGYGAMADELHRVSFSKSEWEAYARHTFLAHAAVPENQGKLRFLQYVTKDSRTWWESMREKGAVVL